ncbi:hypothetical protein DFS34DRAFT_629612 [Phlyctochytrium arcticum]|nr:hypothetical protein DFS34DRAFT_629612 [Phlyctochytrium arcticum]
MLRKCSLKRDEAFGPTPHHTGPTAADSDANGIVLPLELWTVVAKHLTGSHTGQVALSQLARTCRAIAAIVRSVLYISPVVRSDRQSSKLCYAIRRSFALELARVVATDPGLVLSPARLRLDTLGQRIIYLQNVGLLYVLEIVTAIAVGGHDQVNVRELPRGLYRTSRDILLYTRHSLKLLSLIPGSSRQFWKDFERDCADGVKLVDFAGCRIRTLADDTKCDPVLKDAVESLLPSDRLISSVFLHFPSVDRIELSDSVATAAPSIVLFVAIRLIPQLCYLHLVCELPSGSGFGTSDVASVLTNCSSITTFVLEGFVLDKAFVALLKEHRTTMTSEQSKIAFRLINCLTESQILHQILQTDHDKLVIDSNGQTITNGLIHICS